MPEGENFVFAKAAVPESMIGKKLYDACGKCYVINEKPSKSWLGKGTVFEVQQTKCGAESLSALMKQVSREVIGAWLQKEAIPYVTYSALEGEALLAQCIVDGERQFRKEFIEKLGAQGAAVWRNVLKSQAKAIVKIFRENNLMNNQSAKDAIVSSGVMPPGGRFKWTGTNGKTIFTLYCIECLPCVRNIHIFGSYRRLAFPYVVIMPLFQDGVFCRFFAFYGKEEIKNDLGELYFPNLPHIRGGWPYEWCVGGREIPRLDNPDWPKQVQGIFWDSSFVYNRPGQVCEHWLEDSERIPEVSSAECWEKFSRNTPEKMIQLPWRKMKYGIGEYARRVLESFGCGQEPVGDPAREAIFYDNIEILLRKFESQLQEELHFLGATFSVQPAIKASAEKFAKDSMNKAGEVLSSSFDTRANDMVKKVLAELQGGRDKEGGKDV